MLSNFHLAALAKQQDQKELFHIPLHQALQDSLAEVWGQQLDIFSQGVEEIAFNAGYKPESHERFRLSDFDLPDPLRSHKRRQSIEPQTAQENGDRGEKLIQL